MEQDLHGPGFDARGAAFPGVNLIRPARPRARLRVERDDGDLGQRRHVRRGPLPGRLPLPATRASAGRWRSSSARTPGRRTRRRPDAAGLGDADRVPHGARHRLRARDGRRQEGRVRPRALDVLPRGRQRGRLLPPQRPELRHATPSRSARPSTASTSRFNWSYIDAEHIAYQLSGWLPAARARARRRTSRSSAPASTTGRASTPSCFTMRTVPLRPAPARDRPALPRLVEQQAGAGLGGGRRQVLLRAGASARR